jgi:hypothetical protein
MSSSASYWAGKARQFRAHVTARVGVDERARLIEWLSPPQLALFDSMHVADRRHGLDVVATLRADGVTDDEVLLAGLLHDAGKGHTWVWRIASFIPGWRDALRRLRDHAETSAVLAEAAGCPARTVELIRHQDAPIDPVAGRALQLADEAN